MSQTCETEISVSQTFETELLEKFVQLEKFEKFVHANLPDFFYKIRFTCESGRFACET